MNKFRHLFKKIFIKFMSQKQYQNYLRKQGVHIGKGCDIDKSVIFGNEPWLIWIGDNVRITRNVQFITHDGGLWTLRHCNMIEYDLVKYGKIIIKDNCNISWNSIIMPNVKINENCIVAAGAVVTHDVESNRIVGGVPAKEIETLEEYKNKVLKSLYLFKTNNMTRKELRKIVDF